MEKYCPLEKQHENVSSFFTSLGPVCSKGRRNLSQSFFLKFKRKGCHYSVNMTTEYLPKTRIFE